MYKKIAELDGQEHLALWVKSLVLYYPEAFSHLYEVVAFARFFPNLQVLTMEDMHFSEWTPALDGFKRIPAPSKLFPVIPTLNKSDYQQLHRLTTVTFQNCASIHLHNVFAFLLPFTPSIERFKLVRTSSMRVDSSDAHPFMGCSLLHPDVQNEWSSRLLQAQKNLQSMRFLEFGSSWTSVGLPTSATESTARLKALWFTGAERLEVLTWTSRSKNSADQCAEIIKACRRTLRTVAITSECAYPWFRTYCVKELR